MANSNNGFSYLHVDFSVIANVLSVAIVGAAIECAMVEGIRLKSVLFKPRRRPKVYVVDTSEEAKSSCC